MMTRKEMITKCVEDQVRRGIVRPEEAKALIKARLTGGMRMSWTACERWYKEVFEA